MNLRQFSIALLVSALPVFLSAKAAVISLNHGDFIAAERKSPNGDTIIKVKLSKSGKAKFKKLNDNSLNKEVHAEIAGVSSNFKLKVPIVGEGLEMGPYSSEDADKVITEINKK